MNPYYKETLTIRSIEHCAAILCHYLPEKNEEVLHSIKVLTRQSLKNVSLNQRSSLVFLVASFDIACKFYEVENFVTDYLKETDEGITQSDLADYTAFIKSHFPDNFEHYLDQFLLPQPEPQFNYEGEVNFFNDFEDPMNIYSLEPVQEHVIVVSPTLDPELAKLFKVSTCKACASLTKELGTFDFSMFCSRECDERNKNLFNL